MNSRTLRLILLGMIAVIAAGEVGARLIEDSMPQLSDWPTLETEVKAVQLEGLGNLPDVLVVGSSVTESGVDPARLLEAGVAESAYNSAFPFYSPAALQVWLEHFVEPWGEVDTLLIGLPAWPPPRTPEEDSLRGALEDLVYQTEASNPLGGFALWNLRTTIADLDEALHRKRAVARGRWTALGHQTYWHDLSGETFGGHGDYGAPEMVEHQRDALEEIVLSAQKSGTRPVIVIEPGRFSGEASNETIEDYLASLATFAEELGVELWDAYSVAWDASLFADGTHLNYQGTLAYTEYLAAKLEESTGGR